MIVLTGGPCSGKTTALAHIFQWLSEKGFHPLFVPEAATEFIQSGFDRTSDRFQELMVEEILHKEYMRQKEASLLPTHAKPVIICDRGVMDGRAYNERAFLNACTARELSLVDLRDKRYTGIIVLQSAAIGAEEFYTLENNPARHESLEEARVMNEKTRDAWMGAPHVREILNLPGKTFDDKMQTVLKTLARFLGIPEPIECERKFELLEFDRTTLPAQAVDIDIVQTYLVSPPHLTERVRARGQNNQWVFFHTTKVFVSEGVNAEYEKIISQREYEALLVRKDSTKHQIHKTRTCFSYNGQYFEVDQFHGHREGLILLELELTDMTDAIAIPSYIGLYVERTGNPAFSNVHIADPA